MSEDNYDKVNSDECDAKDRNNQTTVAKKACTEGFKAYKTAQDDSVDNVGTCKKVNKCGGVANATEGARQLKILAPLSNALANTAFEASSNEQLFFSSNQD